MLTARDAVEDRVAGLDAGADDYLAKPFAFDELAGAAASVLRRAPGERPTMLRVGELRLDPAAHRVWRGERELDLSAKEFALLELFMRNPGAVLARAAARRRVGHVVRTAVERDRRLCPLPAGQGRPRRRSRRCAASATGCEDPAEQVADPRPSDARVRARDGVRDRRDGGPRLRPCRRRAAPLGRPDTPGAGERALAARSRRARPRRSRRGGRRDTGATDLAVRDEASTTTATPRLLDHERRAGEPSGRSVFRDRVAVRPRGAVARARRPALTAAARSSSHDRSRSARRRCDRISASS